MPRSEQRKERSTAPRRPDVRTVLEAASAARKPRAPSFEARQAKAAATLVRFYQNLGDDGRAKAANLYATRGWENGLRAELVRAGAPADMLSLVDSLHDRGGLQAIVEPVERQVQAETFAAVQAGAEHEALGALAQLSQEQWAVVEQLHAEGGPQRVFEEFQALASPAAAMVIARTVEAQGVAGTFKAAATRLQHHAAQVQAETAAQKVAQKYAGDEQAAKQGDPFASLLGNPDFHRSAQPYAERLAAAGLMKKGETAGEAIVRLALLAGREGTKAVDENPERLFDKKWTGDEAITALAGVVGESPAVVQAWLHTVHDADAHRDLRSRLAKGDAEERARRGPDRPVTPHAKAEASRRAALEKAAEKLGIEREDDAVEADSLLKAQIAIHDGQRVKLTRDGRAEAGEAVERRRVAAEEHRASLRGQMERAAEHIEARQAPERSEAPSGGGRSVREALEAADAAGGGTSDE